MNSLESQTQTPGDEKHSLLGDEVLEYLIQHPEAQDTIQGITEWWLLERRVTRAMAEVEAALGDLLTMDFLVAHRCQDGQTYFRLNRAKLREVRRYLRKPQWPPEPGTFPQEQDRPVLEEGTGHSS